VICVRCVYGFDVEITLRSILKMVLCCVLESDGSGCYPEAGLRDMMTVSDSKREISLRRVYRLLNSSALRSE
jgi:hypothetical protein